MAACSTDLSAQKDQRVRASKLLTGPEETIGPFRKSVDADQFIEAVRQALYAFKICSYAQGFFQLQAQRDYFGAHTYERLDQEGTFHTEWLQLRRKPKD